MSTEQWKAENRELMRKYRREWYARNSQHGMDAVARRKQEIKDWCRAYKKTCVCKICGETHPACLTFHHRQSETKIIEVSIMTGYGCSKKRILAEIAKCDVLCANCHAKLHWGEFFE